MHMLQQQTYHFRSGTLYEAARSSGGGTDRHRFHRVTSPGSSDGSTASEPHSEATSPKKLEYKNAKSQKKNLKKMIKKVKKKPAGVDITTGCTRVVHKQERKLVDQNNTGKRLNSVLKCLCEWCKWIYCSSLLWCERGAAYKKSNVKSEWYK